MGKILNSTLAAVVLAASTAVASSSDARELTVVGWGGPIMEKMQKAFLDPHKAETGIEYRMDEYNGEFAKIRSMVETNNVIWDVIQVEHPELVRGCEEGLFARIDPSKVGGEDRYIKGAIEECGVGQIVWSMVYAYNADTITGDGPKNWADFWNVEKWPGKRGLRQSAKPTLEAALLADGVASDKLYEVLSTDAGVDRAFAKLDELKPDIIWWKSGAQPAQWLAAGDVVMSSAYNGRMSIARQEGKNFKIVWDGQGYAIDFWAIINGSPNVDEALSLLEYSSRTEPGVEYAALTNYGPPSIDAAEKVSDPELPTNPKYISVGFQIDTEFWINNGEALEQRFQSWVGQ
jgi:putative spermidine/putrescine transport system substrate-binding protein